MIGIRLLFEENGVLGENEDEILPYAPTKEFLQ